MLQANVDVPLLESSRDVIIVDRDAQSSALLARYLEKRSWNIRIVAEPRSVVRGWGRKHGAAIIVLHVEDGDPDIFEVLAAREAGAISAAILVKGELDGLAESFGVECVLGSDASFADIATALEDIGGSVEFMKEVG